MNLIGKTWIVLDGVAVACDLHPSVRRQIKALFQLQLVIALIGFIERLRQ